MSNSLAFNFENTSLTVLGDILNPLFIAQQICSILGFTNPRKAVADHCDPEDVTKVEMLDRLNRKQLVNCVNESGLYALIFGSKLPKAKQFKRWVTNEVLPAIRKQGYYQCPALDQLETLTPAQQDAIRKKVAERALLSTASYKTIYKALRLRFQVRRFELIPRDKFIEALNFIRDVELKAPVVQQPKPDAYLFSYNPRTLSADELRAISNLIYLRELGKPTFEQVYNGLSGLNSQLAPRFYSLIHESEISAITIKDFLHRNKVDFTSPN